MVHPGVIIDIEIASLTCLLQQQSAAQALALAPTSQGAEAALAFAMARDTARAENLAADLGNRFPLDTQMQSLWLPAIQAQLALDKKDAAAALKVVQASVPIELGGIQFVNNTSCLYHVYIHGEAYLAANRGGSSENVRCSTPCCPTFVQIRTKFYARGSARTNLALLLRSWPSGRGNCFPLRCARYPKF